MPLLNEPPGTKTKYYILAWFMKIFQPWNGSKIKTVFHYLPTHKKRGSSVKDYLIYNKDRSVKRNVMEYQEPLKLPKIKIFPWRWIQNLLWLYFLIFSPYFGKWAAHISFLFLQVNYLAISVSIDLCLLQSVRKNTIACVTILLEFLLLTNIYWAST